MLKFASEFTGKKVILRQEGLMAGEIEEVVINPENGEFLGFVLLISSRKKQRKALPEKEIMGISREFILVKSADSLGDLDEVVRIKKAREQKISIANNRVYTVSNTYLGKVNDYTIDLISGKLSRLYITPRSISGFASGHVIDAKRIVSIKKNRITVDDATVKGSRKAVTKGVVIKTEC